jgi:hypothetical protein
MKSLHRALAKSFSRGAITSRVTPGRLSDSDKSALLHSSVARASERVL